MTCRIKRGFSVITQYQIIAAADADGILRGSTEHHITACPCRDPIVATVDSIDRRQRQHVGIGIERGRCVVSHDRVVPVAGGNDIRVCSGDDDIATGPGRNAIPTADISILRSEGRQFANDTEGRTASVTKNNIAAVASIDGVACCSAHHQIVASPAANRVNSAVGVIHRRESQQVTGRIQGRRRAVAGDDIVACSGVDCVTGGTAEDQIVTVSGDDAIRVTLSRLTAVHDEPLTECIETDIAMISQQ